MSRFRTNTPKPLKELVKDFLDDVPYRMRLKRGMILSLWDEAVGEKIAEQTENLRFAKDKLILNVKNPAWRHEIHMKRFSIAKKHNYQVGEKIIKEIIVRS